MKAKVRAKYKSSVIGGIILCENHSKAIHVNKLIPLWAISGTKDVWDLKRRVWQTQVDDW